MNRLLTTAALLVTAALLWGCDAEGLYEKSVDPDETLTLSSGVAIHQSGLRRIAYLEAKPNSVSISQLYSYRANEKLAWLKTGPSSTNPTDLFAMSVPTDQRDASVKETLVRISGKTQKVDRYTLGSSFDRLSFDPLQKYAILFHGEQSSAQDGLFNPNEAALIDSTKAPGADNPAVFTVHMGSRRIKGVTFLQELHVGGQARQLAVFRAEGAVRIVDIGNPTGTSTLIPLVAQDDPRTVVPVQMVSRDEDEERAPMVFIRAEGSQDIYGISLSNDGEEGILKATLNQFEAGGIPLDMVVAQDGDTPILVVLSHNYTYASNTNVSVVDIDTADIFSIQLDDAVNRIHLNLESDSPEVVFYGDNGRGVHFLTIDNLSSEKGRNLDNLFVPDPVNRAMLLDKDRLLLVSQESMDLIILNLNTRKSTRLSSPVGLDWNRFKVHGDRLYFVPESDNRVDIVNLNTEHPLSLLLDDEAGTLHLTSDTEMGIVLHPTETGRATIFPLKDPSRAAALVVDGLWLDGFLDGKEGLK